MTGNVKSSEGTTTFLCMHFLSVSVSVVCYDIIGHFRVLSKTPHSLKRGQVQNLSCENEFYLHDNKKLFTQERFCTWPRFKTEACGISEVAYFVKI